MLLSSSGISVVDYSDLASPKIINTFNTVGTAVNVDVTDDSIYVADGPGGLVILSFVEAGSGESGFPFLPAVLKTLP